MGREIHTYGPEGRYTPDDNMRYVVPDRAIRDTEKVLIEYADIDHSNEGLVYWGGTREYDTINVVMVIAPQTESDSGRVSTSNRSNFDVVRSLSRNQLVEIAQVHSHPGFWVGHSPGDDDWAPFRVEGLVSIVVPDYGRKGMLPLTICGVHRYTNDDFIRLSDEYIKAHFGISNTGEYSFEDLRNE